MVRRASSSRRARGDDTEEPGGGLGSMLRGSVNSMVGAAGLNLPLRAVERLTAAVETATVILQRIERASTRLDDIDDDLLERAVESLDLLADLRDDARGINEGMRRVEQELAAIRRLLGARADPATPSPPKPRARHAATATRKQPSRPAPRRPGSRRS